MINWNELVLIHNSNIAVIDADLIGRKKHRFPNLVCMKISSYYKGKGCNVELKTDYKNLDKYKAVFVAKVFTDTEVPKEVLERENVFYDGTGFYYDKAGKLPNDIEHCFPDYHLYDTWVQDKRTGGVDRRELVYYLDYSIGFLTRGCFRKCQFCVNKNSKESVVASPLLEFLDKSKPKICLLDDNFFACSSCILLMEELRKTGKRFRFKQGLDERLLTKEKIDLLFSSKTDGDLIFAFDDINDQSIICKKLDMIKTQIPNNRKTLKFYIFCGFDRRGIWNESFWKDDIYSVFRRIEILMSYGSIPYIMRFNKYVESPHKGIYINLARWCNQPNFFKKKSFREFCVANGKNSACYRYMEQFEKDYPDISKYFDMEFEKEKTK